MYSLINASIFSGWLVLALTTLLRAGGKPAGNGTAGYWSKEAGRIRRQAEQAGVSWDGKETRAIWIISLSAACGLYFLTGNLLLFGAGWLLMLVLPRVLIYDRKHRRRLETLTALTDCLRQLLARLPDQGSLARAMEMVVESDGGGENTRMLRQVLETLRLGSNVRDAIGLWQGMVRMSKFDHVAETLIQANQDGWTPAALKALEKSVEGLEGDMRAILVVAQKAAGRRRQLYMALATSWSFPLILSLMDTGQKNLYWYSLPGRFLMFAYIAVSLYVIVKGQEYLSLNVDEL
ncbi:MAG: hypothetical protein FWG28_01255 [Clostridiales bacterium]|nr:hypothetical protein [Clostridiales bacterium]